MPFLPRSGKGPYAGRNIIKGTLMPRIALASTTAALARRSPGNARMLGRQLAVTLCALLLGLVFLLPPAWAGVDRDEAASLAQRVAPGRVLAVERGLHVDNRVVWRIKVLTASGEIRLVVIDAETGRSR
jgi:hypothetical protein